MSRPLTDDQLARLRAADITGDEICAAAEALLFCCVLAEAGESCDFDIVCTLPPAKQKVVIAILRERLESSAE